MTRNFIILEDFNIDEEVKQKVNELEQKIFDQDFEYMYVEARKILEKFVFSNLQDEKISLGEAIKNHYELNSSMPFDAKDSCYFIKKRGNLDAHWSPTKKEKSFKKERDVFSSVELLKHIFIIVKYFISIDFKREWEKIDKNKYIFDSDIYLKRILKKENNNIENESTKAQSNDMKTECKGIYQLISGEYNFLIPTYQREYTWDEKNINVLISDIEDRMEDKKTHYLGALAISIDYKNKLIRLIDGQQRTTTTLIFIRAIIDVYKERDMILPKEIQELGKRIENKYQNRVAQYDQFNFIKIILKENKSIISEEAKKSRSYKNYKIFLDYLISKNEDYILEFLTTFIKYFVVAEIKFIQDIQNEIQIFENLNSKGTELSEWDLIKNYIYKNIDIDFLLKEEEDIENLIKTWFLKESAKFFGNENRLSSLNNFFIFYSRWKYKLKRGNILTDKGKSHKIFSKVWPENKKIENMKNLKNELIEIYKLFCIYCQIKSKEYLNKESKLFKYRLHLENIHIKDAHLSLVMHVIYNLSTWNYQNKIERIEEEDFLMKFLSSIDKYISRLLICSNKGQSLSKLFDNCIVEDVKNSYSLFIDEIYKTGSQNSIPNFKDFEKTLKEKNDWQKEYAFSVFRTLEYYHYHHENVQSGRYEVMIKPSLEHIFPITTKKDSYWRLMYMDDDLFEENKKSKINKLGNYIVLNFSLNAKAKNFAFSKKLDEYKKDPNNIFIKGIPSSLMNLKCKKSFSLEDIDNRTNELAKLIAPLYKMDFD